MTLLSSLVVKLLLQWGLKKHLNQALVKILLCLSGGNVTATRPRAELILILHQTDPGILRGLTIEQDFWLIMVKNLRRLFSMLIQSQESAGRVAGSYTRNAARSNMAFIEIRFLVASVGRSKIIECDLQLALRSAIPPSFLSLLRVPNQIVTYKVMTAAPTKHYSIPSPNLEAPPNTLSKAQSRKRIHHNCQQPQPSRRR